MNRSDKLAASIQPRLAPPALPESLIRNYRNLQTARTIDQDKKHIPQMLRSMTRRAKGRPGPPSRALAKAHRESLLALRRGVRKKRQRSGPDPVPATPNLIPPGWVKKKDFLFFHQGNYSFATPDPEFLIVTPADRATGIGSTQIEAVADPLTGQISLGFIAGNFFNATGGVFSRSPMPETFPGIVPCDGISTAASIFQLADISQFSKKAKLRIVAGLRAPVQSSGVDGNYAVYPGLPSSTASGYVAVMGHFNLTVSAAHGGKIVRSNTNSMLLLLREVNNSGPDSGYGAYFDVLEDDCAFISPDAVDHTIYLATNLLVGIPKAEMLIVEAQVRLVGLRAGIGDKGAGYVGARFYDPAQASPVAAGIQGYVCPFQVVNMGAYLLG